MLQTSRAQTDVNLTCKPSPNIQESEKCLSWLPKAPAAVLADGLNPGTAIYSLISVLDTARTRNSPNLSNQFIRPYRVVHRLNSRKGNRYETRPKTPIMQGSDPLDPVDPVRNYPINLKHPRRGQRVITESGLQSVIKPHIISPQGRWIRDGLA